jgi:hypothetical protein
MRRAETKALEILCTRRPSVPSGSSGLLYISLSFIEQPTAMQLHPAVIEDHCENRDTPGGRSVRMYIQQTWLRLRW